jgi:hypothetical protein
LQILAIQGHRELFIKNKNSTFSTPNSLPICFPCKTRENSLSFLSTVFILRPFKFKGIFKGAPRNYKKALYWFTKAAKQGNVKAQGVLDKLYK